MKVETKEIYSEVYQILNLLGTEYTEKLPATLMNMLKEKFQKLEVGQRFLTLIGLAGLFV